MSSEPLGQNISDVEVTNVGKHGVWILVRDHEHFMPYEEFPWFRDAPVGHVLNVVEEAEGHLYWPDLDVDLGVETLEHPERYPLKAAPVS
ncbi:MAG: hypothetical protein ACI8TX_002198 [Hyphomicrobiaceae bacterium]|jgi:hypothetical protein